MSNPNTFMTNYCNNIVNFVKLLETLRINNSQIDADSTLLDRYFSQPTTPPAGGSWAGPPRTDIVAADVTAAHDAINQVLATYDGGTPTVKSAIFKMEP